MEEERIQEVRRKNTLTGRSSKQAVCMLGRDPRTE